jgi:hypothetical protein
METVYALRNDPESISQMQRGSSSSGPIGLLITHGLIGSQEWWTHIESGVLPLRFSEGVVSGFWPGQYGDGPAEFEVRQPDGQTTHWLCQVDPKLARTVFIIGRAVIVQYVGQQLKPRLGESTDTKVTTSISLGEA